MFDAGGCAGDGVGAPVQDVEAVAGGVAPAEKRRLGGEKDGFTEGGD